MDAVALLRRLPAVLDRQDRAGANGILQALLATNTRQGERWRQLAHLALHHGEIDLAISIIDRFVAESGRSEHAMQERAVVLARAGRLEAAVVAVGEDGADAGRRYARATMLLDLGRTGEASDLLASVVAQRPAAGSAWLALAVAGGLRDPAAADRLFAAAPLVRRAPPAEQVAWHHAAGRVLDARGDHDDAFTAFAQAAILARRLTPYHRIADARDAQVATLGSARIRTAGDQAGRAIVVTGLPRSGTTLVEQILASHSAVTGGGELNLLRLPAQDAGGTSAEAVAAFVGRGGKPEGLAALYDHLLGQRFGLAGRVVDKSLNTSRFMGLLMSILPGTPVIWIRRDPVDTAWSCFRNHFVGGVEWSHDLADMAYHFRLEDALHRHWADLLGQRLLTVPYEALIDDPRHWTRVMLDHCDLPDEPGPYAPHEARRAVTTSSVMQVRRPINRDGLGVSAAYRKHLQPFVDAYYST